MTSASNEKHDRFLRLYVEHEESLKCFVRSLVPTREDGREVMQEVAVVLWRRFEELPDIADFRRWAFGVAKFKALAFVRDRMRDRLVFDEDVVELLAQEVTENADAYEAERQVLDQCLSKLDPAQKKLLEAAYAPGVRIDEVATAMGRSPKSFYMILHRIRLALMACTQRALAQEGLA